MLYSILKILARKYEASLRQVPQDETLSVTCLKINYFNPFILYDAMEDPPPLSTRTHEKKGSEFS